MNESSNVYHVTGPPGTGKTESLSRWARRSVLDEGQKVGIASLTRAAAGEIRERTQIRDRSAIWVGTLHKLCMETLGVQAKSLVVAHIDEWNEFITKEYKGKYSMWTMSPKKDLTNEQRAGVESADRTRGDELLDKHDDYRHRMISRKDQMASHPEMGRFIEIYSEWKQEHELLDFTDLIDLAYHDTERPRFYDTHPDALVIDECQDSTKLELALVRDAWAPQINRVILAGDPDQCLYEWRSADPGVFMDYEVPEGHRHYLKQSYRVPRAVHAYAQRIIRRIHRREDVEYLPRDEDGELISQHLIHSRHFSNIERYIVKWMDEGTVMLLATNQYTLRPIVAHLKEVGIPFHNPWAPSRGEWNPIRRSTPKQTSTSDRFLAFLMEDPDAAPLWEHRDFHRWFPMLRVKGGPVRHGAKTKIEQWIPEGYSLEDVRDVFKEEADLQRALARDEEWLWKYATARSYSKMLRYCSAIHQRFQLPGLINLPKVSIGTIHSTKGSTADTVILLPDVTPAMRRAAQNPRERDAHHRLFYVGATRARNRLVLGYSTHSQNYPLR